MKIWRCKECGGTEFIENYVNGYRKFGKYDSCGEPIVETLEDDDPEIVIECEECGNRGYTLQSIATYE